MTEQTIHFDNPREADALIGSGKDTRVRIEEAFGVRLAAREDWVRIAGEEAGVSRAARFLEVLRDARDRGFPLHQHSRLYALSAFLEGREEELQHIYRFRIDVCPSKPPVFPRTFGQWAYVRAIAEKDLTFGIGPAGTGKTYLAMAMAVAALLRQEVSRIILTRPAVEAGEALGFLPGDLHEKIYPYLRPLYDALYDMMPPEEIERQRERGVLEIAPLAFMRGRTLNHAFVILDEAQNTTEEQMFMFLTRLGFDSKCVVTGDLSQVDLPPHRQSGLLEARRTLEGIDDIALMAFHEDDVVRHALVQKVIMAYRKGRETNASPAEGNQA